MNKKLVAPMVITTILVIIIVAYIVLFSLIPIALFLRIVLLIAYLGLLGVAIYVLIERIKEIRSGEEDDLSKY